MRTCRGITKDEKGVPVEFDKGIDVQNITGDFEDNLSERRSRKLNESNDCMYCREKEIIEFLPSERYYFFLIGQDFRPYSEMLQVGKDREGERK